MRRTTKQSIWISRCISAVATAACLYAGASSSPGAYIRTAAFDCEPIGGLERTYRRISTGADVNDNGVLLYADENALYMLNLDALYDPNTPVEPIEMAKRWQSYAGSDSFIIGFTERMCINDSNVAAWISVVANYEISEECMLLLSCGETGCSLSTHIAAPFVLMRRYAPTSAIEALHVFPEIYPHEIYDFDLLEKHQLDDSGIVAAAVQHRGPGEPAMVALYHAGTLAPSVYASVGEADPEGIGYYAASTCRLPQSPFHSVTSGYSEPTAFSAEIEGISPSEQNPNLGTQGGLPPQQNIVEPCVDILDTIVSKRRGTVMDCDVLAPNYTGHDSESMIDLGCVEGFGPGATVVVHYIYTGSDEDLCTPPESIAGIDAVRALAETNVAATSTDTRVLLVEGEEYETLDCNELYEMGEAVSASVLSGVTPGQIITEGAAVFRGLYKTQDNTLVKALFACTGVDEVYVLVDEGTSIPPMDPNSSSPGVFTNFSDPVLNERGEVVFWGESDNDDCEESPGGRFVCGGIFVLDLNSFLATLSATEE